MSSNALIACPLVSFTGDGFRYVPGRLVIDRKGALDRFFAGKGAGRCNPEGVKRIYLGLNERTAKAEFDHYQRLWGLEPDQVEAYRFALRITVTGLIDLRDKAVCKQLGLTDADLAQDYSLDPNTPTKLQALGAEIALAATRAKGIILPSARQKGGFNIVLFTGKLVAGVDSLTSYTKPAFVFP